MIKQTDKFAAGMGRIVLVLCVGAVMCSYNSWNPDPDDASTFNAMCEHLREEQGSIGQPLDGQGVGAKTSLPGEGQREQQEDAPPTAHQERGKEKEKTKTRRKRKTRKKKEESDERRDKNTGTKRRKWKAKISTDLPRQHTSERIEEVLSVNRAGLDEILARCQAELDGRTGCREGSLEWIETLKGALEGAVEALKRKDQGEDDARQVIELVAKAVKGYEDELESRKAYLKTVIGECLPPYLRILQIFADNKERVLMALANEKGGHMFKHLENIPTSACTSTSTSASPPTSTKIAHQTYQMVLTVIRKGLEDLAEDRRIEDLRRHPTLSARIDRQREWRAVISSVSGEKTFTHVLHHLKNTLLFLPLSTIYYDSIQSSQLKDKKTMAAQGVLSPFFRKHNELRERLRTLELSTDVFLTPLAQWHSLEDGGVEAECRREEKEKLKRQVILGMEELQAVEDVHNYMAEYYRERKTERGLNHILFMEGVESYIKSEGEKGAASLGNTLQMLYRAMRRSGYNTEAATEQRRDKKIISSLINSNRTGSVQAWIGAFSREIDEMERWVETLNETIV